MSGALLLPPSFGGSVNSVTAGDASIVVAGTTTPTIETGTLDVIATLHPPAAAWSNNSKQIKSVAAGTASTDAANFGQIPTSLPPSGAAGGVLTGTYPNPGLATVTVPEGGTGGTAVTSYAVVTGGTTSTSALQTVSGVGIAGQILTSNDAGSLPTWQTIGPLNGPTPATNGLLAWNYDIVVANTGGGLAVNQTLYMQRIDISTTIPSATKLCWGIITAGVAGGTANLNQNLIGLYNSSGTLLGSGTIDSTYVGTTGFKTATIPSTNLTPGQYYVGILYGGSGTAPSLMRSLVGATQYNFNTATSTLRCANGGTGITALPSPATLSTLSSSNTFPYWVGIS